MKEIRLEYPEELGPVEFELRVQVGDEVNAGDVIAVASTDKATQEVEAYQRMRVHTITRTARGYVFTVEELNARR